MQNEVPIVNRNDEVIGHKERAELDFDTDIFRTASLWITNSKGEVLLAQRKLDKRVDPGKWAEAVGGTVEGDDTYEQTVIREAEEELGLRDTEITLGPKQFITTPTRYFVQWYTAVIDQPVEAFSIQEEEVEQIAWFSIDELKDELEANSDKYIEVLPEIIRLFENSAD